MKRYLLYLKYDGSQFHGWQVQPNGITVQEVMCQAAEKIFGQKIGITGCSRTDSGVHANMFCCHFDSPKEMAAKNIVAAFNSYLPRSVAVFDCKEVADDFHARYSAKGKNYVYRILNSSVRDPFLEGYALRVSKELDVDFLNKAMQPILGKHDFSAFCAAGCSVEDHVRTISHFNISRSGDIVEISVSADGFLYNMVRIIAGTTLDIANGKIDPDSLAEIINSKDRSKAGQTAPAHGLYLNQVFY